MGCILITSRGVGLGGWGVVGQLVRGGGFVGEGELVGWVIRWPRTGLGDRGLVRGPKAGPMALNGEQTGEPKKGKPLGTGTKGQGSGTRGQGQAKLLCLVSTRNGDSECGGEHGEGEEILEEMPLGDSSDTDLSEEEPAGGDLAEAIAGVVPVGDGIPPLLFNSWLLASSVRVSGILHFPPQKMIVVVWGQEGSGRGAGWLE